MICQLIAKHLTQLLHAYGQKQCAGWPLRRTIKFCSSIPLWIVFSNHCIFLLGKRSIPSDWLPQVSELNIF